MRQMVVFLITMSSLFFNQLESFSSGQEQEIDSPRLSSTDTDGPVKPPKIKKKYPPVYPPIAESLGCQCEIVIESTISEQGILVNPAVKEQEDLCLFQKEFEKSALLAVKQWKFKPAVQDGKQVSVQYTLKVTFHQNQKSKRNVREDLELLSMAYTNRAILYYGKKNFDRAREDYTAAIDLHPSEIPYRNRGFVNFIMKKYEAAIEDFSKAIEFNPNQGETFYYRGLSYSEKADCENATADYETACTLNYVQACSKKCH